MTLLGLFALAQVLAVFIHFLPALRSQVLAAGEVRPAANAAARPAPSAPEPEAAQPTPAAQDPAVVARASQLVNEADRLHRIGDFEGSLGLLKQAEAMLPSTPEIQFRIGQALEGLGENGDAYLAYEKSVSVPGLTPDVRRQAEQKMALLTQALAGSPSSSVLSEGSRPATPPGGTSGGSVRESSGLQPGAALGIIDARLQDSQPGAKTLRIAVKSREGLPVDTRLMNVHVYFYEKDEFGEVMVTESKPTTQWISPPIDWADAEPELLDIEYALPDGGLPGNSGDMGAPGRAFFGYVVGVYYNNELQDARSEPADLQGRFPLKLDLSQ